MLETGIQGNKRQSWSKANPRDLLARIIDANPHGSRSEWYSELRDTLLSEEGADYLNTVIEYWFSNNLNSIDRPKPAPRPAVDRAEKAAKSEAMKKAAVSVAEKHVELLVEEKVERILLDLEMPTGKTLRDSTGAECAKAGGWFQKIASHVKPNQKVGKVLSEDQVRGLWKATRP